MPLKKDSRLIGQHALLSPSTYHWLRYDEDKLRSFYFTKQQAARGDKLHALAQQLIELQQPLPDDNTTLSMYVNDAIGFRMQPEVPLFYTPDCFGTTDAIGVRDGILRIHDLKTGISPASIEQLLIYAALFFFEYAQTFEPKDLTVILRIYQNDAIEELRPTTQDILTVMSDVRFAATMIRSLREED